DARRRRPGRRGAPRHRRARRRKDHRAVRRRSGGADHRARHDGGGARRGAAGAERARQDRVREQAHEDPAPHREVLGVGDTMTRNPDPLHNPAAALSEDVAATPANALLYEAAGEPGGGDAVVASFDRIAARAGAQSRRRRLVERLRALLPAWPAPIGWTSAMAGVAGICVMVIAGGLYLHQPDIQLASAPLPVDAGRMLERAVPAGNDGPMSLAPDRQVVADRAARTDHAAAEQPAPAAAPPVVAAAPPPAPPAAAGVARESKGARIVEARPQAPAPGPRPPPGA